MQATAFRRQLKGALRLTEETSTKKKIPTKKEVTTAL